MEASELRARSDRLDSIERDCERLRAAYISASNERDEAQKQLAAVTAERDAEKQRADDLAANLEIAREALKEIAWRCGPDNYTICAREALAASAENLEEETK